MSDAGNRSADVPVGALGSSRSLGFGTSPNFANATNTNQYVDIVTPSASYVDLSDNANWSVSLWYRGTDVGGSFTQRVLLGSAASNAQLELRNAGGSAAKVVYAHFNG